MTPNETAVEPTGSTRASRGPSGRDGSRLRRGLAHFLEAYALLGLLLLVAAFFSLYGKTGAQFLTTTNIQILLANQAVIAVVTLGLLFPLVCNEFDLSVGAAAGLSAIITATVFSAGI